MTGREYRGIFWGDGKGLPFDLGDSTWVYIYFKNSLNYTLKIWVLYCICIKLKNKGGRLREGTEEEGVEIKEEEKQEQK